eukprot:m51a1_g12583 hypothetical protein (214) ;mRNA; r:399-1259
MSGMPQQRAAAEQRAALVMAGMGRVEWELTGARQQVRHLMSVVRSLEFENRQLRFGDRTCSLEGENHQPSLNADDRGLEDENTQHRPNADNHGLEGENQQPSLRADEHGLDSENQQLRYRANMNALAWGLCMALLQAAGWLLHWQGCPLAAALCGLLAIVVLLAVGRGNGLGFPDCLYVAMLVLAMMPGLFQRAGRAAPSSLLIGSGNTAHQQ